MKSWQKQCCPIQSVFRMGKEEKSIIFFWSQQHSMCDWEKKFFKFFIKLINTRQLKCGTMEEKQHQQLKQYNIDCTANRILVWKKF